jgi:general secretion pathway protein C
MQYEEVQNDEVITSIFDVPCSIFCGYEMRGRLVGFEGFAGENIVRYNDCKNCFATQTMARKEKLKKNHTDIPPGVRERVVQVSVENPDFGPSRLVPLLEEEGIFLASSIIYTILKRNNLQNRSLRILKLEEQQAVEIIPEPPPTAEPPLEEPTPVPAHTIEIEPEPPKPPATKFFSKFTGRRLWPYTLTSLLVVGLVAYFLVSAATNLIKAGREPVLAPQPAPAEATSKIEATVRPLEDYNIIFERNLFGTSQGQTSAPQEKISVEDVPTADETLGLKLVGTVASDDPETSFAIIDNKNTRKQELYQEGDKAGEVLIKKILRNKVIVDSGKGEELLALELEETGRKVEFSPATQPAGGERSPATRENLLRFDRAELEASLKNVDQVIQELKISPFMRSGKPAGFRIGLLPADSILIAMGLRSGDLIIGVNDQAISGPEQAPEFFQTLKQGGDVTIKVGKGRGVRLRGRVIHLKIE